LKKLALLIERVPPTCPASTPDPVTAWMAVAGSGVSPRQATFEAPALPAKPRSRRQPPWPDEGLNTALGELHPHPVTGSGAGPLARGDAPNLARAGSCLVVERAPYSARTDRSSDTSAGLAHRPALAIASGQCSPGRATPRECIRGERAVSSPMRAAARRLPGASCGPACASPGRCSRPAGRGEIAERVAKRKPASTVSGGQSGRQLSAGASRPTGPQLASFGCRRKDACGTPDAGGG